MSGSLSTTKNISSQTLLQLAGLSIPLMLAKLSQSRLMILPNLILHRSLIKETNMNISFTATEASFEVEEYALILAVEGSNNTLVFQRDSENSFEDWGLYLEFGEQHNGGYECVSSCYLNRKSLQVNLSNQLGELEGITSFEIVLEIDDNSYNILLEGLPRVFRDMSDSLHIS
jgi:hypothetical protein